MRLRWAHFLFTTEGTKDFSQRAQRRIKITFVISMQIAVALRLSMPPGIFFFTTEGTKIFHKAHKGGSCYFLCALCVNRCVLCG